MQDISNKTIIVTGGTGFIGSHLVEELIKQKANVVIPYIEILPKSKFVLDKSSEKVTMDIVDITDKKSVYNFIKKHQPEYIFHLAAETLVTDAYTNPVKTLETNIMGTIYLLEAARLCAELKAFIFASSDKAYGKTTTTYTEESALRGDHPYDVSKSSADLIAQAYYKTYKTPIIISRFGNVYGEGDLHFDRLIPGICEAIIQNKVFEVRSDGSFVRDYVYVKDVVLGYITLLEQSEKALGQAFNFSSQDSLSVLGVISQVENVLRKKINYTILNTAKNEIPYQHLNDDKVRKLGWKSEYTLEKIFPKILSWYKNFYA